MFRARYIGVACADHVRWRRRCAMRRLRRAVPCCLIVLTRNVLPRVRAFWLAAEPLLRRTVISSFLFTRRLANALVLGLVPGPWSLVPAPRPHRYTPACCCW